MQLELIDGLEECHADNEEFLNRFYGWFQRAAWLLIGGVALWLLDLAKLMAECGLSYLQRLGGTGDATMSRHLPNHAEVSKVEAAYAHRLHEVLIAK